MDTPVLVGLVLFIVVGFFAWQWWSRTQSIAQRGPAKKAMLEPAPPATPQVNLAAATPEPPTQEQKYPVVAGQSEQDLRAKEPIQEARPANPKIPVDHMNTMSPAPVEENLRHPEQLFHQPTPVQEIPNSDVDAGRASMIATPGAGNVQQFTPEMAQNGGALIGNSVFAFDGMEPTGFAAF
jgi:hypothetical protein